MPLMQLNFSFTEATVGISKSLLLHGGNSKARDCAATGSWLRQGHGASLGGCRNMAKLVPSTASQGNGGGGGGHCRSAKLWRSVVRAWPFILGKSLAAIVLLHAAARF